MIWYVYIVKGFPHQVNLHIHHLAYFHFYCENIYILISYQISIVQLLYIQLFFTHWQFIVKFPFLALSHVAQSISLKGKS